MRYHRSRGWGDSRERDHAGIDLPQPPRLRRRLGRGAFDLCAAAPRSRRLADPTAAFYPAKRNPAYTLDREVTPEAANLHYNNFYEFATSKRVDADALKTRPWAVTSTGWSRKKRPSTSTTWSRRSASKSGYTAIAASKPGRWRSRGPDLRCVRWSNGRAVGRGQIRPIRELPRRECRARPEMFMPWPYTEGLTIAEATNDLAFVATGAYGKPIAKVQGAPIRLATPWKYGFKSAKSIVKISFVADRPQTFWQQLGPDEYGFWPTSTRMCRTALEPSARDVSSRPASSGRRCSSTATPSRSPRSTRDLERAAVHVSGAGRQ